MKFTENFNLNLPDLDDIADVEKLNENFQTIDTKMKSLETDPELAANVVDIKNKIGTESDADTQPTLFGRLAQLKNVLVEKLAEVLTKVTGIDGKIGTSGDTAGSATLFGQVKDISEKMPTGAVKSVQEIIIGNAAVTEETDEFTTTYGYKDYTINEVNKEKSVVLVYANIDMGSRGKSPAARLINNTTVRVYGMSSANGSINNTYVQIVEFN